MIHSASLPLDVRLTIRRHLAKARLPALIEPFVHVSPGAPTDKSCLLFTRLLLYRPDPLAAAGSLVRPAIPILQPAPALAKPARQRAPVLVLQRADPK